MKLANTEIRSLWNTIAQMADEPHKAPFVHGLLRNRKALRPVIERLQEQTAPLPRFQQFEQQRIKLTLACCEVGEDGQPRMENGQVFITDDAQRQKFTQGIEELTTEYGQDIEAQKTREVEAKALMAENTEVELHPIPLSMFPDGITLTQMEALDPIIAF